MTTRQPRRAGALSARRLRGMPASRHQGGAVLIVSLILLVILTMLGVSAMNSTQLEERMAANSQEATRAFQAAESGLSEAFNDITAWDLSGGYTRNVAQFADTTNDATLSSSFLGWTPPPPGSLYSATSFQAAHFDFASEGKTASDLSVTVHGGAYQIAPKQGGG